MNDQLPPLPLFHDGDSYLIYLVTVGDRRVRIVHIERYPHNDNRSGVEENFRDLDDVTRMAIVRQINRRHIGKTVLT